MLVLIGTVLVQQLIHTALIGKALQPMLMLQVRIGIAHKLP